MSRRSSGSIDDDIENGLINSNNSNVINSSNSNVSNITNISIGSLSNIITKECAAYCESSNPDSELIKVCINKHYMHIECINEVITKSKAMCPMCRDEGMMKKFKTINNKYDTVDSGMYINTTIIPKNIISTDSFVDITFVDGGVNNKLGFPGLVCTLYSFIFPACVYVILSGLYN